MSHQKLWIAPGFVLTISFAVLGGAGVKVLRHAPPIPSQAAVAGGGLLFGVREVGTIRGHGSYVAPDGSAGYEPNPAPQPVPDDAVLAR